MDTFLSKKENGVSIDSAFHPISTDIRPVQAVEGFSAGDVNESLLKSTNLQNAIDDLTSASQSSYITVSSIYTADGSKYDESNIKTSANYVPDKNDQVNLEYKQRMDQHNMLMSASVITGLSISVLIAMLLAKST